jgi:hypothetical protein
MIKNQRKNLALIFFAAAAFILAGPLAFGQEAGVKILEKLSNQEIEELDIEIPADTPVGYHELIVEIFDENDVVVTKKVAFCKDNDGIINWNNECPNIVLETGNEPISQIKVKSLKDESREYTSVLALIFIALYGLVALRPSASNFIIVESAKEGSLAQALLKSSAGATNWSTGFSRLLADGSRARSLIRSGYLLLYILASALIFVGYRQVDSENILIPLGFMLALGLLSSLDNFVGFFSSISFMAFALTFGEISSSREFLGTLAFALIFFAPRLLAGALTPIVNRRDNQVAVLGRNVILGGVITAFVTYLILEILPFIYGREIYLSDHQVTIALAFGAFALVRNISDLSYFRGLIDNFAGHKLDEKRSKLGTSVDGFVAVLFFSFIAILLFEATFVQGAVVIAILLITALASVRSLKKSLA